MTSPRSPRPLHLTFIAPSLLLSVIPWIANPRTIAQPAPVPTIVPIAPPATLPTPPVGNTKPLLDPIPDLQLPPGSLPPREPADPRNPLANITIDSLIDELRTASSERHDTIVREFERRGKSIIPALIKALETNDPLVRRGVATALGKSQDAAIAAVPALVKLTSDNRRALFPRNEYSYSPSITIGSTRSWNPNQRSLPTPPENPRNLVSITALGALGRIGPAARRTATEPLTQLLKNNDPWIQLHAAWALNQMGAETPVLSTYLSLLQNPDVEIQRSVIDAIENDPLINKVVGAETNPAIIQQMVQALATKDDRISSTLQNLLTTIGGDAIPSLTTALKSPNPTLRSNAARTLGRIGKDARSAIPDLLPLLNDLGQSDPKPAITQDRFADFTPLEPARPLPPSRYYGDQDFPVPSNSRDVVRIDAMIAIARILRPGETIDDRAIATTRKLLQDRDPEVQLTAAWFLQRFGVDAPILSIYINALSQPQSRDAAKDLAWTFSRSDRKIPGDRFTSDDRRNLFKLVTDDDTQIREIATRLLSQIGASIIPELTTLLRSPEVLRKQTAIDILIGMGPAASSALPTLTGLLQDPSSYKVPNWSSWMGTPAPALRNYDRRTKSYYDVSFPNEEEVLTRSKAIDAIGRICVSNPETLARLNQLAQQDKNRLVRLRAAWAAIVLGADPASHLALLEETLKSTNRESQWVAKNILENIGEPASKVLLRYYLQQLDRPEERVNVVLWLGNNRLGAASLEAVPKIRPYLEGSDKTLRGYTVTILANIADSIINDAKNDKLSDRQLKSAIAEFTKVTEITQKPNAPFNTQPVERLRVSLDWLKRHQANRSGK